MGDKVCKKRDVEGIKEDGDDDGTTAIVRHVVYVYQCGSRSSSSSSFFAA